MSGTGAERARRHRRHVKGDHSLCLAGHCDLADDAPPPTTQRDIATGGDAPQSPVVPRTERGPRGQELWDGLAAGLPPAQRLMLDEACRIADRLDRLDLMLTDRDVWLSVITSDGGDVRLVIDGLLAETRQQATALKGLLVEVAKAAPKAQGHPQAPTGSVSPSAAPRGIANLLDQAEKRRRRPAG